MRLRLIAALLLLLGTVQAVLAQERSAPLMTNGDVVKLVKGGLSKEIVIQSIRSRPNRFDVSADALLDLKNNGVPDDVIQAMVSPRTETAGSKGAAQAESAEDEYLWLYDGEKKIRMERAHVEIATKVGFRAIIGVGYGYFDLSEGGPAAALRITNKNPSFGELSAPLDRRVAELVFLVKLEVDPDTQHRQVQAGRYSIFGAGEQPGYPQEARIPVVFTDLGEATVKGKRMRNYRMAPASPLVPGEYAVAFQGVGVIFDFGVDP